MDVARRAGVSKGAVSFALNDRPGVAPQTRDRILAAARELEWQPSTRAVALSRSRAFAVGLVMRRAPELLGADPFFPQFLAGVETALAERGSALVCWTGRVAEGADVAWLRPCNYQAFAILTMCRDLYVLEHGVVLPKPPAAAWAARRLGPPWPAMTARALSWRADERPDDRHLPETLRLVAATVELARRAG
jgi:regulatory LacI family protein/aminoglycoside adenylyltransferase-like protein